MPEPSTHAAALLARVEGVVHLELRVLDARSLSNELREVRLDGAPDAFRPWPGQDLMLGLRADDGEHRWRRYTVRALEGRTVTLWMTTDTGGPGARWALDATPRVEVEAVGPRGKLRVLPHAASHVFVVDAAGVAAAAVMAESLRPPSRVHLIAPLAVLDVGAPRVAAGVEATRSALPAPGSGESLSSLLRDAIDALVAPVAGYAFGELQLTRQAREGFVTAGVGEDLIATKAYWRADRSNEPHGEPAKASE